MPWRALPTGTTATSPLDGPLEVRRDGVPALSVLDHCLVPDLDSGAIACGPEHRDPCLEGGDNKLICAKTCGFEDLAP